MGRHQGQTSASFAAGHNRPGACGTCVSGSEKGRATVRRVIGEGKRRPPSGFVLAMSWSGKIRFFGYAELHTGVLSAQCPLPSHSSSTTTGATCLTPLLLARCEIQWAPPVALPYLRTRTFASPRELTHLREFTWRRTCLVSANCRYGCTAAGSKRNCTDWLPMTGERPNRGRHGFNAASRSQRMGKLAENDFSDSLTESKRPRFSI
jgi:hypothetical protein